MIATSFVVLVKGLAALIPPTDSRLFFDFGYQRRRFALPCEITPIETG